MSGWMDQWTGGGMKWWIDKGMDELMYGWMLPKERRLVLLDWAVAPDTAPHASLNVTGSSLSISIWSLVSSELKREDITWPVCVYVCTYVRMYVCV